jgi:hypothetical protein
LGKDIGIISQLLAFNIGIELAQIILIIIILVTSFVSFNMLKIAKKDWNLVLSGAAIGISVILIKDFM